MAIVNVTHESNQNTKIEINKAKENIRCILLNTGIETVSIESTTTR